MEKRLVAGILLLLLLPLASALCQPGETVKLSLSPATAALPFNTTLDGTFSVNGSGIVLGATLLEPDAGRLSFDDASGAFSFTPTASDMNLSRILFYAVTESGCTATRLAEYTTLFPPPIRNATPAGEDVALSEHRQLSFSADAGNASVRWLLDGRLLAVGNRSVTYLPDFNDAGAHLLELLATGGNGLNATRRWNITVRNVNREPVQVARIVGLTMPIGVEANANMDDYFLDPDGTELSFSAVQQPISAEAEVDRAEMAIALSGSDVTLRGLSPGKAFLRFTATDAAGASVTSDPIAYVITPYAVGERRRSYCGDALCISPEKCATCAEDCGACGAESCTPEWACSDWGACEPTGYQRRSCAVANGCENVTERPEEAQPCDYEASCTDGIRNGKETGVDCGGDCLACPTCDDGLRNQGEEDVDCGGPCAPCPTCDDGLRNQDEADVDCGGSCAPCAPGMGCAKPADCLSMICGKGICVAATCSDGLRNQEETGIDCGGPCTPCPTCTDRLQNQEETGVDCGGPCAPCPTCADGTKNQGEKLADCGGPCRACAWRDYAPVALRWLGYGVALFLALAIIYLLRSILASRMIFLFQHGKGIHFFYEDRATYALVRLWNGFARHFRIHRHRELQEAVEQTYHELAALRGTPPASLQPALVGRLRGLYGMIFSLVPAFEYDALVLAVRRAKFPFCVKVILLRNTSILYTAEMTKLYTDPTYALHDALRGLEELRTAF